MMRGLRDVLWKFWCVGEGFVYMRVFALRLCGIEEAVSGLGQRRGEISEVVSLIACSTGTERAWRGQGGLGDLRPRVEVCFPDETKYQRMATSWRDGRTETLKANRIDDNDGGKKLKETRRTCI